VRVLDKKHWLLLPEGASGEDGLVFFDLESEPYHPLCKVDHKSWVYDKSPSELFAFSKEREAERAFEKAERGKD
jgi:hypothetical protein